MVGRHRHHLVDVVLGGSQPAVIGELVGARLPGSGFAPHRDASLITQVQETFVLGIVGTAHEVGAKPCDQLEIRQALVIGQGGAMVGVQVMAVDAEQPGGTVVHCQVSALYCHRS